MIENDTTTSIDVENVDITAEFVATLFSINIFGKIIVILRYKPTDTKTKEVMIKERSE
jgi:hypothetical protein